MPRLPVPGSDDGTWGNVLNEYLTVEHNADGTLKASGSLGDKYTKPASGIPKTDLETSVQSSLTAADNAVPNTRQVLTGAGLSGGGDLTADRTLTVSLSSATPAAGTRAGTAGSSSDVARADHVHPIPAGPSPEDWGFITYSMAPPATISTSTPLTTAGTIYITRVYTPKATTVTNIWVSVVTAGSGLTAGQCFAALYDGSGNLLSATADQSTAWASTGSKQMALSTPQSVAAGYYDIAYWFNGTSGPAFIRGHSGSINNINLTGSTAMSASANTGVTTAPATLSGRAAFNTHYFAALS